MKPLILTVALFGTLAAAPQKSNADEVVVRTGGGHENDNWNHEYWHHHKIRVLEWSTWLLARGARRACLCGALGTPLFASTSTGLERPTFFLEGLYGKQTLWNLIPKPDLAC
jgi:hypothetical protein